MRNLFTRIPKSGIVVALVFVVVLLRPHSSCAQLEETVVEAVNSRMIDEEILDYEGWLDLLSHIATNRLDANKTSAEELRELGLLDDLQLSHFLEYRGSLGPFLDIHELQAIPGWSRDDVWLLQHFLEVKNVKEGTFGTKTGKDQISQQLVFRYAATIEQSRGFSETEEAASSYLGGRGGFQLRWKIRAGKRFEGGILIDKDPGEHFFQKDAMGFDHYSGFVSFSTHIPWVKQVIIGDYKLNMGQGLIAHGAFLSGKSSSVMQLSKSGPMFTKMTSAAEYGFLRGMATEFSTGLFSGGAFISANKVDTNLEPAPDADSLEVETVSMTSLIRTGYHRTTNELADRKNQWQITMGGIFRWGNDVNNVGMNVKYDRFAYPFTSPSSWYQYHRPISHQFLNLSMDHRSRWKNSLFHGEFAWSVHGGWAFVEGIQTSLARNFDLGFLIRWYQPQYFSLDGAGFGSSASTSNEKGIYLGFAFSPLPKWKLSGYFDIWHHPWLKYTIDAPGQGYASYLRLEYNQKRKWKTYVVYSQTFKQVNESGSRGVSPIQDQLVNRLTLHLAFSIHPYWEIRSRMEWRYIPDGGRASFLLYQDILYKPLDKPFSFTCRYAVFDSPDYLTRLFAYENDLLFSSSIPAYYKTGVRFYFNFRYKLSRVLTTEIRYAISHYPFESSVSSGNEEIEKNQKSGIKLQVRLSF